MDEDSEMVVDAETLLLCRLCIDKKGTFQIGPQMQKCISTYFSIPINPYDGMSQILCRDCKVFITDISRLRDVFRKNQETLLHKKKAINDGAHSFPTSCVSSTSADGFFSHQDSLSEKSSVSPISERLFKTSESRINSPVNTRANINAFVHSDTASTSKVTTTHCTPTSTLLSAGIQNLIKDTQISNSSPDHCDLSNSINHDMENMASKTIKIKRKPGPKRSQSCASRDESMDKETDPAFASQFVSPKEIQKAVEIKRKPGPKWSKSSATRDESMAYSPAYGCQFVNPKRTRRAVKTKREQSDASCDESMDSTLASGSEVVESKNIETTVKIRRKPGPKPGFKLKQMNAFCDESTTNPALSSGSEVVESKNIKTAVKIRRKPGPKPGFKLKQINAFCNESMDYSLASGSEVVESKNIETTVKIRRKPGPKPGYKLKQINASCNESMERSQSSASCDDDDKSMDYSPAFGSEVVDSENTDISVKVKRKPGPKRSQSSASRDDDDKSVDYSPAFGSQFVSPKKIQKAVKIKRKPGPKRSQSNLYHDESMDSPAFRSDCPINKQSSIFKNIFLDDMDKDGMSLSRSTRNATKYNCIFCVKVTMDGVLLKRHIHTHHAGLLNKLKSFTAPCSVRLKNIAPCNLPTDWVHFDSNKVYQFNPKDTYFFLSKRRNAPNPDAYSSSEDELEKERRKNYKSMKLRKTAITEYFPLSDKCTDSVDTGNALGNKETGQFISDKLSDGNRWNLYEDSKEKNPIDDDSESEDEIKVIDPVLSPKEIQKFIKENSRKCFDLECNVNDLVDYYSSVKVVWQRFDKVQTVFCKKNNQILMATLMNKLPAYDDIDRSNMDLSSKYYYRTRTNNPSATSAKNINKNITEEASTGKISAITTNQNVDIIDEASIDKTSVNVNITTDQSNQNENITTDQSNQDENASSSDVDASTIVVKKCKDDETENISDDIAVQDQNVESANLPLTILQEALTRQNVNLVLASNSSTAKRLLRLLRVTIKIVNGTEIVSYFVELLIREDVSFILVVMDLDNKTQEIEKWPENLQIQIMRYLQNAKFISALRTISGKFGKYSQTVLKLIEVLESLSFTLQS